jgi:hypothetical protein
MSHGDLMSSEVSKKENSLGPIATVITFENEYIRVWALELGPKGHQPLHEHHLPYLIVPLTEGKLVMKWEDGRSRDLVDKPGDVKYREPGDGPHELFNLEETDMRSILVEIKARTMSD